MKIEYWLARKFKASTLGRYQEYKDVCKLLGEEPLTMKEFEIQDQLTEEQQTEWDALFDNENPNKLD